MNARPLFRDLACLLIVLALGALLTAGVPAAPEARADAPTGRPSGSPAAVASISMTVSDLDASIDFYTTALGFVFVSRSERATESDQRLFGIFGARLRTATLALGDERLELLEFLTPQGAPYPADSRSNDHWFQHIAIAVRNIDEAYTRLRDVRVRYASESPQTLPKWNKNAAGISAFYFKDPDGHVLEIIHFPQGKGDPRWHSASDRLFLGIDHTAIVVADTERSLAFYRDTLGLREAGASQNYGPEQERLNNVFAARLRITTLRAPAGPGVELLEYLSPSDGRDYPRAARPCDLIHWHTTILVTDPDAGAIAGRRAGGRWVSPGAIHCAGGCAALLRDPDGHAVMLQSLHP